MYDEFTDNLMMSYNVMLSQDVKMVNTNDILNGNNVNVGNDDEVNWSEKKIEDAKIKTAAPLYVGDGLFQGDEPQKNDKRKVINEAISSKKGSSGNKQEVMSHQPSSNPYSSINIKYKSSNVNSLPAKSVLAGTKLVLFGRYVLKFYI